MRAVKGGVVVVAGLVLAIAGVAHAGTVRQTAGSTVISPDTTAVAKAKCGKLKRVGTGKVSLVGAGFSATGNARNQGLQPLRRKLISMTRNAGPEASQAKAYGYCAKRIPTTIRTQRSTLTPGTVHNVFVHCGKGETALAGGWKVLGPTPPTSWSVLNSVRPGRGTWAVSIGSSSVGTVRAYAICTSKDLPIVARRSSKTPVSPGVVAAASARCPRGSVAMSGGFETAVDEGTGFSSVVLPTSSRRSGAREWAASGIAEMVTAGSYIRSHALCLEQPAG